MFDMGNEEIIMKLIDERDKNCHVIPLYVHINNQRYNLWELKEKMLQEYSQQMKF